MYSILFWYLYRVFCLSSRDAIPCVVMWRIFSKNSLHSFPATNLRKARVNTIKLFFPIQIGFDRIKSNAFQEINIDKTYLYCFKINIFNLTEHSKLYMDLLELSPTHINLLIPIVYILTNNKNLIFLWPLLLFLWSVCREFYFTAMSKIQISFYYFTRLSSLFLG